MRMSASRYSMSTPAMVKGKPAAVTVHQQAPLKGLSLSTKLAPGDPLTALRLSNYVLEDDRIQVRAGHKKLSTIAGNPPIWCLIPHYGDALRQLSAADNKLFDMEAVERAAGFTSNDWHWTSYSDLGEKDYTIMVNGADGVWSWDGDYVTPPSPPVAATSLTSANPAVITVGPSLIAQFRENQLVTVAGATGTGTVNANGAHTIVNLDYTIGSFELKGVDTSGGATQTTGVTVDPPPLAGIVKENIWGPANEPWIVADQFQIVVSHMNRLWFADSSNLAIYYLPLAQRSGEVKFLPLNLLFKRGGSIKAIFTWSVDGGRGMDDQLVIFTTNGECAIYSGTDPDSAFQLVGVYRFDSPMSKHSIVNYGGDLYVLISTGLVPMTTVIRAETENLSLADKNVISLFRQAAITSRTAPGWQVILNPSTGRLICNVPVSTSGTYEQIIRHMERKGWSQWENIPARCWSWINPYLYFGDNLGNLYEMHPNHMSDDGQPITADLQCAWSNFKSSRRKHFKMAKPYLITDGIPEVWLSMKQDYDTTPPINHPDVSLGVGLGAEWDISDWDTSDWAGGDRVWNAWTGVYMQGVIGAFAMRVSVLNCRLSFMGVDIKYEEEIGALS